MRRKRAAELLGAGAGLRRLSDREKTLLIDRLRPALFMFNGFKTG